MLEYTMLCVPSILKHSRPPFELIFLDVGSLDGTLAYLKGIKAASQVRVEIVRTRADIGLSDACKEAVKEGAAVNIWCCSITTPSSPTGGSTSSLSW